MSIASLINTGEHILLNTKANKSFPGKAFKIKSYKWNVLHTININYALRIKHVWRMIHSSTHTSTLYSPQENRLTRMKSHIPVEYMRSVLIHKFSRFYLKSFLALSSRGFPVFLLFLATRPFAFAISSNVWLILSPTGNDTLP